MEEMNTTDFEANPEQIEAIAEHLEVPSEEATVETFGTWEDQSEDWWPEHSGKGGPRTMLYKEPQRAGHLGREVMHSRNATVE